MEPGRPRLKSAVTFADTTKDNIGWHQPAYCMAIAAFLFPHSSVSWKKD